jgi:cold shock CspA family protein
MKAREYGVINTHNGSYAFITPDGADRAVFAHSSELPKDRIYPGDRVSFDVAPDPFKPGKISSLWGSLFHCRCSAVPTKLSNRAHVDVCYWPKADIPHCTAHVCFQG